MTLTAMHLRELEERILADFLAVAFLHDLLERSAFGPDADRAELAQVPLARAVLERVGVLDANGLQTEAFLGLLAARDGALQARIRFLRDAARDILDHGADLLARPERFMAVARVFSLFDYSAGFREGRVARAATQDWCNYVAALSDIEGPALARKLADMLAPDHPADILEVGGNNGTFAAHVLACLGTVRYRILDIPQVCAIGSDYAAERGLGITFLPGDMHRMDWAALAAGGAPDCILFKSVLHDWPTDRTRAVLADAAGCLAQKGRIVIVERAAFVARNLSAPAFSDAANAVFAPFYREATFYQELLSDLYPGARLRTEYVDLDMRWFILVADLP